METAIRKKLLNPIIRKFIKQKLYSPLKDNTRGSYLEDTQLISKFKKKLRFLLCFIDIYSEYAWDVS